MGVFPKLNSNMNTQFWIAARYMESISFLLAAFFLRNSLTDEIKPDNTAKKTKAFVWKVFFGYAIITIIFLLSIYFFKLFPVSYVEDSGFTSFKIRSEYFIFFILLGSLIALYTKKDRFEPRVLNLLAASIIFTMLGELSLTFTPDLESFSDIAAQYFKVISFYLIYKAIVETGFEDPFSLLFRELKQSEEALRQETIFLKDDQGHIYKMLGVNIGEVENESLKNEFDNRPGVHKIDYQSFLYNVEGIIGFLLGEDLEPIFIGETVEAITGYTKEELLSGSPKWTEIVIPEDRPDILENIQNVISNPETSTELEYRIRTKSGEIKWIRENLQKIPEGSKTPGKVQGIARDITKRKIAEETVTKFQDMRIKEIHHRIKNNLQVISSLLSLEAERFSDPETLEAFRESQNRVVSMALIHEELYEGNRIDTIDFAAYLQKLSADLFSSYSVKKENIKLELELEQVYLDMDTAIPLGIIVNELISNSLKHAFSPGKNGEIRITLCHTEGYFPEENTSPILEIKEKRTFPYILKVTDTGKGMSQIMDFKDPKRLGLQLVNILIEQIDAHITVKTDHGTEFTICFRNAEI